jgi:hypothetical protein
MSSGVGLNKNFYSRPKTVGNHGNMPPFYKYTQEKKYKVIGDKCVEV